MSGTVTVFGADGFVGAALARKLEGDGFPFVDGFVKDFSILWALGWLHCT